MLKNDLVIRNPLRLIAKNSDDILSDGGFGAVVARAGIGKTALLVQVAMDNLLKNRNVLHISLGDPVKKVCLWYEEVFRNIADQYKINQMDRIWESLLPHRLIMTFNIDGFSAPKLEERLSDLTVQSIFMPQVLLIDGLPFDENVKDSLSEIKELAERNSLKVWFTVRTHRHEEPGPDGMPPQLMDISDFFDVIFKIQPEDKSIYVTSVKGGKSEEHTPLLLDPSTMLIKEGADQA